jgi:chromate reductase
LGNKKLKILGFAGSLRKGSYNKALLRTGEELLQSDITMEVFEIEGIPLFNQDTEKNIPAKVKAFKSNVCDSLFEAS